MIPSRQTALARLLIAAGKAHKEKGEPAPHMIPLGVAEDAIRHLEAAWGQSEPEIERLIQNISVGLIR